MRLLSIMDVSPFIHAGHVNKRAFLSALIRKENPGEDASWHEQITLAGGTALLLKAALNCSRKGDIVFCCDRNPTIKKSMYAEYKGNRKHGNSIESDKKLAEYVLRDCGATVLARDGYEADDIIYSLVQKYHDSYDAIHIYTADSDLYFLVDDIVSVKPSSSRAKEVTMDNFSYAFKKGTVIPYNFAVPYKLIHGDSSDCIPPIPACRDVLERILSAPALVSNCGKREVLEKYIDLFPVARSTFELIWPLTVEDLPDAFSKPKFQQMVNWAATMNCREYYGMDEPSFNADQHISVIQSMGLYEEE